MLYTVYQGLPGFVSNGAVLRGRRLFRIGRVRFSQALLTLARFCFARFRADFA
jgi:hypothetical protein